MTHLVYRNAQSIIAAGKKAEHFYAPKPSDEIDFTLKAHGLSGNIATSYNSAAPPYVTYS
jgi:hypothetical protein